MKNAVLALLGSAFFIFPSMVLADSFYNGCDSSTDITNLGGASPSAPCATPSAWGVIPQSLELYGITVHVLSPPSGALWYKATGGSSDTACYQVSSPPVATGYPRIVLDHPLIFNAGGDGTTNYANVSFYNSSGCSSASDMTLYNLNLLPPANYHIFWWTPLVASQPEPLFSFTPGLGNIVASTTTIPSSLLNFGGVSTTTASTYCDANVPLDNSNIIQATITFLPNGLCKLGFFLVVPAPESVNQFTTLASTTQERFPFSYFTKIATAWDGLVASSTANSPTFSFNLHSLGIGSTTALGNILPDTQVFGASTTLEYFPPGTFDTLKALAGIALLLTLIADIFFSVKRMMK